MGHAAMRSGPATPAAGPGLARAGAMAFNGAMPDLSRPAGPRSRGPSQEELILRVARGRDRAAFATLFLHFAPRLKSCLMRLGAGAPEAEELAQEVMLTVWRRAEDFDPAQASAGTWIFAIARNRHIDAFRRERRPEIDPGDPALVPAVVPDAPGAADDAVAAAEDRLRLEAAIGRLPAEQEALLRMAYFEDKAHGRIAQDTGLPLGTVKSRLRLALARLRRELGRELEGRHGTAVPGPAGALAR
jgi:RNA polymerase sigma factor (sigma-70 family)